MPRNPTNKRYKLPAVYKASPGTPIRSPQHNVALEDLESELNSPRPVEFGGTGASDPSQARQNLKAPTYVPDRAALKALAPSNLLATLLEATREISFVWDPTVPILTHQADTNENIYVAPDPALVGAWVAKPDYAVSDRFPAYKRPLWAKLGDVFSALDAGVTNAGSDTTAALQDLATYCAANTAEVAFPSGRYLVTSKISASLNKDRAFIWRGRGDEAIIDLNTGGDGIELTIPGNWWIDGVPEGRAALDLSNLTLTTTNAHVGKGLSLLGNCLQGRPHGRIQIDDLTMRSRGSISGQGFADWVSLRNLSNVKMKHPVIRMANGATGTRGIRWFGDAQANSPTGLRLLEPDVTYGDVAIEAGDYCEGLYVTQPEIVASITGIKYRPAVGESGLHVFGGHISTQQYGIDLENLFDWVVQGVLFYRAGALANYSGMITRTGGRFSVVGNVFKGTNAGATETGVQVFSSVASEHFGGVIDGNSFHSFTGQGIWLAANAEYINVSASNIYRQCARTILRQAVNNTNHIQPKTHGGTGTFTLTGGASTENIDMALPTGAFPLKPGSGFMTGDGNDLIGTYDFTNSTTTTARFVLRRIGGANITAGSARLNWQVGQSAIGNIL